jgi:hypothetical protein
MRITATHIEVWADTRDAQAQLPLLVRRLVQATSTTTALAMRTGDSINQPGWDGITDASEGNPWVPSGPARWEMGCDSRPQSKASEDFAKRVFGTLVDEMAAATFVFVTPRRWRQRDVWRKLAEEAAPWRAVRTLDADDLEAWLERAPAVTLWFAELRGLSGSGIESTESFWQRWRGQPRCRLTTEALLADRDAAAQRFDELISAGASIVAVEADSQEEAAAFACVRLAALGLANDAACIFAVEGWRFVDSNAALRVVIACSPEVAAVRAPREGLSLVVPLRRGDRTEGPLGAMSRAASTESPVVSLSRPSSSIFEQQLVELGEEESDAARLSRSVGRSWSVYRRVCAKNPVISRPTWLNQSYIRALSTLSLVGSWNSAKGGDRSCVEAIDGRPYEELELELRSLSRTDDSPVVRIGTVWRAKSPLELLHLCAAALTSGALDRFFSVAEAVLAKPDPSLELDEEKRWMASVYGKTREESGIVIDAIADSLVKLSVYAERGSGEFSVSILGRTSALVRQLLQNASGEQWLSASGVLRELAEAAPEEFLSAVGNSLRSPIQAVTRLISESSGSAAFGRCWHADLLWAMELLAWSSDRLHRVAEVLATLSAVPVPGNWGNTPARSLQSLFRAWWPQTMASSERRLAVLDRLIRDHNDSAWSLMVSMLPRGSQWASANAAPVWREDDAGKADLRGRVDLWYLSEVGARVIAQAEGRPERIATLVASLDSFDGSYRDSVVRLVEAAAEFDDEGRVAVRDSLCKYLGWHNSYNLDGDRKSRAAAERLRPMFDRLSPVDAVKASLWLFACDWITLPDGREADHERHRDALAQERGQALGSVFASRGWSGVSRLAAEAGAPGLVGWEIGRSALDPKEIAKWLIERQRTVGWTRVDLVLRGLLAGMNEEKREATLELVITQLRARGLASAIPDLLISAPFAPESWKLLESHDGESQDRYWAAVVPGFCKLDRTNTSTAVEQLSRRGRARSAFHLVIYQPENVDPVVLKGVLEAIRSGAEPDGPLPDGWHIGKAISAIEAAGKIPRRDLAMLEFAFFRALEDTEHGAKNLYAELLMDPALFMECICLVYKPRNGEAEPINDSLKAADDLAWHILHSGRGIPGKRADGSIDGEELKRWVLEVRRLAAASDRAAAADITIGGWLSDCEPESDGTWPPSVIAEVLDEYQHEDLRRGFYTGVLNNRGVTSRSMGEGGAQERALAARFTERAAVVATRYPRIAETLISVAKHYEHDARREDDEANLRSEGF